MKKFATAIILFVSISCTAQLSANEKKVMELVKQQMPQTMHMLEQLVNINSGTLHVQGVRQTGEVLRKAFDDIGFTTRWITLPDSLKRAGHLVAYINGTKGKKLFLIGHLDTVFEPDMPENPYKKVNETYVTGQGVSDMKGGDMVILAALQALQSAGLLKNASITAYFTGDEEKSGSPITVSRADFIERAKKADVALAFEGAGGLTTVAAARRGSSGWQLKVSGKQAHSSGVFTTGYGAIYEAARIINQFRVQLGTQQYLTFNPGIFVGGTEVQYDSAGIKGAVSGKTNIIAPSAIVQGDLRFLTEQQKIAARNKMKAIVADNNLKGTRASINFTDGIPAMEPTSGNNRLVQLLSKVSVDMGVGPVKAGDPGGRGAGDISYIAQFVDGLDGLGASGSGAHAPGELMNVKEFPILIQRAALFIYRLINN